MLSKAAGILRPVTRPRITTNRELARYVSLVTLIALTAALVMDGVQQMVFFVSWGVSFRNWAITTVIVLVVTIPVSLLMGLPQRELYQAKLFIEQISRTDALTGLLNRRALMEIAERPDRLATVMAIVDIDNFKRINDSFGHQAGDRVIEAIGRSMSARFAELATIGRLGGEEFAVFAATDDLYRVTLALDEFREAVSRTPIDIEIGAIDVTVSIGLAVREPSDAFDGLYADADGALYRAKRAGRNCLLISQRLGDLYGEPLMTAASA